MRLFRKFFIRPPKLEGLEPGEAGEEWVSYLYKLEGYKILARNYALYSKKKLGEIDIVCQKRNEIRIVEVKTRRDENFMNVFEAVDWRKQNYLRRMAKLFIQQNTRFADFPFQIDVAAVLLEPFDNRIRSVRIIENAIEDV